MRHHEIDNANASSKLNSRQNILQREILSSDDSTNHFITKTHVGGKFKNSKQVIASAVPVLNGEGVRFSPGDIPVGNSRQE